MTIKFYRVGGWVRDQILGVESKDIDYSVEAPSYDAMRDEIKSRGGRIFLETPEYHTIRAKYGDEVVDFVLCRKDGEYKDGRHPENVEMGTLMDDLARRDFTMNAIAIDEEGNYIDPHNGQEDIKHGLIRCVGAAEDRFNEDVLRMLRAIRFCITKSMGLHHAIVDCLETEFFVNKLRYISDERIREELHKALQHDTVGTLQVLGEYPLLVPVIFDRGLWLKPTMEKR